MLPPALAACVNAFVAGLCSGVALSYAKEGNAAGAVVFAALAGMNIVGVALLLRGKP